MIEAHTPHAAKGTLLIVDDEECIRDVLTRHFTSEGYACRAAGNVAEARNQLALSSFDLVLTDLLMPGETGLGLLKTVKAEFPQTGVVFITAVADSQVAADALKMGACDFMTKPIHLDSASVLVEQALKRRSEALQEKSYGGYMETIFQRFVSPEMASYILRDHPVEELQSRTVDATILFCDIRNFSAISCESDPQALIPRLNSQYFGPATEIIMAHRGMVNKFIGDGIMAVFGTPLACENHAEHAVDAGREILLKLHQPAWSSGQRFSLGIGIASGKVLAGNVGGIKHMAYTVMGDAVNVAAQLEKFAGPGEMLLSRDTYAAVEDKISAKLLQVTLKGHDDFVNVFRAAVRS